MLWESKVRGSFAGEAMESMTRRVTIVLRKWSIL
jgi:hypothetical protein